MCWSALTVSPPVSYLSHSFCNAIVTKALEFALEFHSCKCAKSLEYQGSFQCNVTITTNVIIIHDNFAHVIKSYLNSFLRFSHIEYHYV